MCRRAIRLVAGIALGATLAGCSSLYLDRREGVTLGSGDALAANQALQTIDPWPPESGRANIEFNGERMQAAVERYRSGKVTPTSDPMQIVSPSQGQSSTSVNITGAPSPGSPSSNTDGTSTASPTVTATP